MEKITTITLHEPGDGPNTTSDKASIGQTGELRLEAYDTGSIPMAFFGREEYEFTYSYDADWKDTILLLLMKDRFASVGDFHCWTDEKSIPHHFESWP